MMYPILELIRPKHWVKNLIIFAPLIFSGPEMFGNLNSLFLVIETFFIFCVLSSAIYVFNDICDYKIDKLHKFKRKTKPLASNKITLYEAKLLLILLLVISFVTLYFYPKLFSISLIFILLNFLYSIKFKHIQILDMFSVATSYLLRIYAGGIVIDVSISSWMFVTVFSTALFIVSLKRKNENELIGSKARVALNNINKDILSYFTIISASIALCFYSLYVIFETKDNLILSIPLVIFIFFRYLYTNDKKKINDSSPVDVLFSDPVLILSILSWCIISIATLL